MSLSRKLFLSYLLVVAVGLTVLGISTAFVAPISFEHEMRHTGQGLGSGGQPRGMMRGMLAEINAQVETSFRTAITNALIGAGAAAIVAAAVVSWFISKQIVHPLQALVRLSQRIAGGHYQERLEFQSGDELADLVRSFNQMAEALQNTETLRHELLADVSHELKTPLASIKGYMEGLEDGVIPASAETFHLIHREASRLQRLVQDLQELSRVEAGQIPIHLQTTAPCALAEAAVERMRPQFAEKDISLCAEVPPSLPEVQADPDRIGQVLTNLLGNALQNTPTGGSVRLSAIPCADGVEFSVLDSGTGIAPENLERVFQRFYRVDKSRARSSGGSGIGLTICRYLVEAHHGRIWAESDGLGQGSAFRFTLPTA
jgi:histidine kinase